MPGKRKHEGSDGKALEDKTGIRDNSTTPGEELPITASTCGLLALFKPRIWLPSLLPAIPLHRARGPHAGDVRPASVNHLAPNSNRCSAADADLPKQKKKRTADPGVRVQVSPFKGSALDSCTATFIHCCSWASFNAEDGISQFLLSDQNLKVYTVILQELLVMTCCSRDAAGWQNL